MDRIGWLRRKVIQHGEDGTAVTIPQDARREAGIEPGDAVPAEYELENGKLIFHLEDDSASGEAAD
jgi:bifunctional DNA-binding transcriptional regulator/antitoxin component of YhaV-PrlF toxin-antitoxin module